MLICRGLRTLFNTLLSSLPAVLNVGSLLFLMFFIYAILGMNLFGSKGNELSQNEPHANFMSFPASMLTLFRLSTGDSWDQILQVSSCLGFRSSIVLLSCASHLLLFVFLPCCAKQQVQLCSSSQCDWHIVCCLWTL